MSTLEVCCGDIAAVIAAKEGGAKRIELCSGLSEGGLTPSISLIRAAVATGIPEINVLIRPRPGDFLYSPLEIDVMEADIVEALKAGATGVVVGALCPDGKIDLETTRRLVKTARDTADKLGRNVNITFHRAFDVSVDPRHSLEAVVALGCDCLLTSGMAATAEQGISVISDLVRRAEGRILIMAGAGINTSNAGRILSDTGVHAIHSTARAPQPGAMEFRRQDVPMGAPGMDEYAPLTTSAKVVAELLRIEN